MHKNILLLVGCLMFWAALGADTAEAGYYTTWRLRGNYYYSTYYYAPTRYHYIVYYPSRPRYIYYYNPYRRVYWGRFDLEGTPEKQYSLLEEKDRKDNLSDIPESAFPKPREMPSVPDSDGRERIETPPVPPPT